MRGDAKTSAVVDDAHRDVRRDVRRDTRRGGRPRDPAIDDAVLRATLELLEEVGYSATTIQAISRRSGVATPAIYRRWANRTELIETAVFPEIRVVAAEASGDLRADLQAYVDAYVVAFSAPATRAALPALLSEYQQHSEPHRVADRVGAGVREAFRTLIEHQPPGTVAPGLTADFVLNLVIGSALFRVFVQPFTGRDDEDHTAAALYRALTCRRT